MIYRLRNNAQLQLHGHQIVSNSFCHKDRFHIVKAGREVFEVGNCCKLGAIDVKRDKVTNGCSYVPFHLKLSARRGFTTYVK